MAIDRRNDRARFHGLFGFAAGSKNLQRIILMTEIKLKKGEPVERALRRLKKKMDREGTIKDVRNRRAFEKPSERKRRKMKASKFQAMLTARYADY